MPTEISALSVPSAGGAFERSTISRRDLAAHDVRITIAFSGICHSDVHQARDEWGQGEFPMVPGHEIAGTVAEVGSRVTRHRVGDRVGVGCFVDSCRTCESCRAGEEQHCSRGAVLTYNSHDYAGAATMGGYSSEIVVDEGYVLRIPDGIDLPHAAPLLCAGITPYSPLRRWGTGPGRSVAIVGLGGLGHLGVKIAHALGARVTVLSHSDAKLADSISFGAHEFLSTRDPATFVEHRSEFDLILNTASADLDVDAFLSLLRVGGAMVYVGLPPGSQAFNAFSLTDNRRSLAGSDIGGIRETQEMLDFCAVNGILPEIEVIGVDEVDDAYSRMIDGRVRYRFVIDMGTI